MGEQQGRGTRERTQYSMTWLYVGVVFTGVITGRGTSGPVHGQHRRLPISPLPISLALSTIVVSLTLHRQPLHCKIASNLYPDQLGSSSFKICGSSSSLKLSQTPFSRASQPSFLRRTARLREFRPMAAEVNGPFPNKK